MDKTKHFQNFVKINEKITVDEAIEILASFHKVTSEAVLRAFPSLKNPNEGDVAVYESSIRNGTDCLALRIYSKEGNQKSSSLIDLENGQPLARHG